MSSGSALIKDRSIVELLNDKRLLILGKVFIVLFKQKGSVSFLAVKTGTGTRTSGHHLHCSFRVGLEILRGTIRNNLSTDRLVTYLQQFLLHDFVDQKLPEALRFLSY